MSENKPSVSGEDSFDAFLSANLPEEAAPDISSRVTPWADALRLILLSIGLSLISFPNHPVVGIIQGSVIHTLSLLGWNRLRGENKDFQCGWILAFIRAGLFLFDALLKSTIWSNILNDLLSSESLLILGIISSLVFLYQLVCLRNGIAAVQKKAGAEEDTSAFHLLIGAYVIILLLALLNVGWIAIIWVIVVIAGLVSVSRLSHTLDEAGYAISPAPVTVTTGTLLGTFFGILVIGSLIGVLFFSSYHMKWTAAAPDMQANTAAVRKDLLALDFPESVLDDLTEEDILACDGAVSVMHQEYFYYTDGLDPLELECIAVVLSENPRIWKIFYHLSLPDEEHYHGTDALEIRPLLQLGPCKFTEEPHGRILVGQNESLKTASIPSVTHTYYDQPGFSIGPFSTAFSGEAYFASFSLPNGYQNARGYVTLTAEDPYGGIDFAWGRRADELIYQRYTQGLFYIHQKSPWHSPVQSAESFRKYSAYSPFHDSPFITVQLQGSWFLTEPLDSPWEMHL